MASLESTETRHTGPQALIRRVVWSGWGCLLLSALCLYLSDYTDPGPGEEAGVAWAIYLMLARLFGIGSFAIGAVAVFNRRWTEGILLFLLSVVLPFIALFVHGTF